MTHSNWQQYKEYKWFQFIMSIVPWVQALSIMTNWGPETDKNRLWIEMAVGALGGGATITTLLSKSHRPNSGQALIAASLIATVDASQMSLAISACYLFRAIGQVIGVAIAAAIQQSVLLSSLMERLGDQPDLVRRIIQEPASVIPKLDGVTQMAARLAYLSSIQGVFAFVVASGAMLTAVCLAIRAHPL